MNKYVAGFAACSLMAAISAVLLGHAAGQYNSISAGGSQELALSVVMSIVAGVFTLVALRHRTPKPPGTPIENRKWCRTEW